MSDRYSMVGSHAHGKKTLDAIFRAGAAADAAAARHGRDRVVNATVGVILDDKEQLAILPTVDEVLRSMSATDFASYSPFQGSPEFRAAAEAFVFDEYRPDCHLEVVATMGATGALRNAFWNYLDVGETVLVPDWRWSPYDTIATEHLRQVEEFRLFDEDNEFTLEPLKAKLEAIFERQPRAMVVVNDPCHNPTGYDMTTEQWGELMDLLRAMVKDESRRLTLFIDAPYLDFAARGHQVREMFRQLTPLPRNLLVTVGYSISKSLTQYGLRTGAFIGLSSDRGVMEEFVEVNSTSARGVWTNVPRAGMRLCSILHEDPKLGARITHEREVLRRMLTYRASVFFEEADEVELSPMPYRAGFFISIPSRDPEALAAALAEQLIFVVPMPKGIRLAISGIAARKIAGVATAVKRCLEALEG